MNSFNWKNESERQWDLRATSWHSKSLEMWENGSRKDIIPFIQTFLPIGSSICDMGCGDGYGSLKLAQEGYKVTGIDASEEMILRARKLLEGKDESFIKGDITSTPFLTNAFDAVMAINSLEWTESPLKVLYEMKRIVKERGYACIGILGPTAMPRTNSFERLYGKEVICNTMMPWEFERLAIENGWIKVDEMGVYKRGVTEELISSLPPDLKQALTFMWVFIFQNKKGS